MAKAIALKSGDRETRRLMQEAHDAGRHGDSVPGDVLDYWAGICADCNAVHRYEVATATKI